MKAKIKETGETLTTEISELQMRFELLKIILAKFDVEDFKTITTREHSEYQGWRDVTRRPLVETQAMEIVDKLINQLKQQSDGNK